MRRLELLLMALAALATSATGATATPQALRVCADPNNLPFSDGAGRGFENELARMLAKDLGKPLEYTWWAQRRGALRHTLKAGTCDVVMGVPSGFEIAATTAPYYVSSYVFVTQPQRHLDISSFDDVRLRTLRVGVQLIGDDYANTPPVHALSARGISENVRGFSVLGDYGEQTPAARILKAVEAGEIDVAIVWGPLAGYVARTAKLKLTPTPPSDGALPMRFSISMAVRHGDRALLERLNAFIARRHAHIDALLARYGVPRL